jgi:hypothetical protein
VMEGGTAEQTQRYRSRSAAAQRLPGWRLLGCPEGRALSVERRDDGTWTVYRCRYEPGEADGWFFAEAVAACETPRRLFLELYDLLDRREMSRLDREALGLPTAEEFFRREALRLLPGVYLGCTEREDESRVWKNYHSLQYDESNKVWRIFKCREPHDLLPWGFLVEPRVEPVKSCSGSGLVAALRKLRLRVEDCAVEVESRLVH